MWKPKGGTARDANGWGKDNDRDNDIDNDGEREILVEILVGIIVEERMESKQARGGPKTTIGTTISTMMGSGRRRAFGKRRTSNAEHRTSQCLPVAPFSVRRWTFDVRCWTFVPVPTPACAEPRAPPRSGTLAGGGEDGQNHFGQNPVEGRDHCSSGALGNEASAELALSPERGEDGQDRGAAQRVHDVEAKGRSREWTRMDAKVDTGMDAAQDSAIMDRATDLAGDAERRLPAANAGGHFRHAAWDSGLGVYDPPGDTLTSDRGLPASGIGNRYLFRLQKG